MQARPDAPHSVYPRPKAAVPATDSAEPPTPTTPGSRATFWLVFAVLATCSAAVWLGVVEHANLKADSYLQQLNADPDLRDAWWEPAVSREQIVAQEAIDEQGNPLLQPNGQPAVEPYAEDIQARIEARWAPDAARGLLYFVLRGFGTMFFGLALVALATSFLAFRQLRRAAATAPFALRLLPAACLLLTAALLARALYLGVFRYAWLA